MYWRSVSANHARPAHDVEHLCAVHMRLGAEAGPQAVTGVDFGIQAGRASPFTIDPTQSLCSAHWLIARGGRCAGTTDPLTSFPAAIQSRQARTAAGLGRRSIGNGSFSAFGLPDRFWIAAGLPGDGDRPLPDCPNGCHDPDDILDDSIRRVGSGGRPGVHWADLGYPKIQIPD